MPNRFQIDGQDVAGFELDDTRHQAIPGKLSSARVEGFPGSRNRFAVKGRATRGTRVVTGTLRADSFDAIYPLIAAHEQLVENVATVSVTFHATTFSQCSLMGFEVTGPILPYSDDNGQTVKAMVPARFVFAVLGT